MAFYSENLPRLFSEKITAVFAVSEHYALEFMRFLQGQGIRVPEDVQIIGFDDTLASRESVPALTTIHQDAALRARTAIRRLEALRDGTPCDAGIVLPVELVERESTRRLPCQTLCGPFAKSPFRSAFKRKQNARSPWRFGHGGRAFYVYFPSTTESLISFSVSLRSRAPPSATVTRSS